MLSQSTTRPELYSRHRRNCRAPDQQSGAAHSNKHWKENKQTNKPNQNKKDLPQKRANREDLAQTLGTVRERSAAVLW